VKANKFPNGVVSELTTNTKYEFRVRVQGSMVRLQFSAIFADFRRKNGVFLKNQCYHIFAKTSSSLIKKAIFSPIFGENIFKNTSVLA
jgi:hypothetical protein